MSSINKYLNKNLTPLATIDTRIISIASAVQQNPVH